MRNAFTSIRSLLEAHGKPRREVYLDLENSGIIFKEALEEMVKAYREYGYGHPSITHRIGWQSYEIVLKAILGLQEMLNVKNGEVVFTHSGTEANNLAIMGLASANKGKKRKKIVVSSIEHLSVKLPAEKMQEFGFKVVEVPVDEEGFVDLERVEGVLDEETLLVSIAVVNHEIGVIQDLKAVSEIIKDRDPEILIHTDACDALGRVELNFEKQRVDLATFSGHKIFGPKGVGALYIRPGLKVAPILHGQLSSQRLWPGVEDVPALAGFSKALEILRDNFDVFRTRMRRLRDMLIENILSQIPDTELNGPMGDRRAVDNVNISFFNCEGEALTVELSLRGVYVSSGSACTSRTLEPSHVLLGIGKRYEEAHGSILMKVSPMHEEDDIMYAIEQIRGAAERIRSIAPGRR